jgi:hypothetical protein
MTADSWHAGVEASTDDRGRLSLGKLGIGKDQRFRMDKDASGVITLVPVVSIPAEELLIWENEQLRESIKRGLVDVAAGNVHRADHLLGDDE